MQYDVSFAVIIPTLFNESRSLENIIGDLQKIPLINEIIIVGPSTSIQEMSRTSKKVKYIGVAVVGSAHQRNVGFRSIGDDISHVIFLDDDMFWSSGDFERLLAHSIELFSRGAIAVSPSINFIQPSYDENPRPCYEEFRLKASLKPLQNAYKWLRSNFCPNKLYTSQTGGVACSGWANTLCPGPNQAMPVQWLPTGCLFVSRNVLDNKRELFMFHRRSYLEDLEFTYRIGKSGHLYRSGLVTINTPYRSKGGFSFGVEEVTNRLEFVRKNDELSMAWCYTALCLRMIMSCFSSFAKLDPTQLSRSAGNLVGLIMSIGTMNKFGL